MEKLIKKKNSYWKKETEGREEKTSRRKIPSSNDHAFHFHSVVVLEGEDLIYGSITEFIRDQFGTTLIEDFIIVTCKNQTVIAKLAEATKFRGLASADLEYCTKKIGNWRERWGSRSWKVKQKAFGWRLSQEEGRCTSRQMA